MQKASKRLPQWLRDTLMFILIMGCAVAVCELLSVCYDDNNPFATSVFILAVVLVSRFTTGYWPGILASAVGVVSVNYLFTYPFHEFNLTIDGYPLTFAVMLVVSVLVSTLTTQIKRQEQLRYEAERDRMRANLLRSVSHDLESARRTENFVSAVTHELRTPLSAIRLYAEMLQDGWVHDDAKRSLYYQRIVREAQRLETLVERVLEKGRLTSKETQVEPGDLNRVVDGLRASLIGPDEDPARDLVFELEAELPPVYLYPEGIRSIVGNLVENARKYAAVPEGGEPIRVVTRRAGKEVVLEVHDRGPGIPESERERVFEAFYRVGNETTRTAKGTGLGLHLVALQADAMGGRVEVLSRPGGGTIFRVHLVEASDADR